MIDWLTNNYTYHTREMCMAGDWPWILVLSLCGLTILIAYFVTAFLWWKASKTAPDGKSKQALFILIAVFVGCGVAGYSWHLVFPWWPGYRLQAIALIIQSIISWSYVYVAFRHSSIVFGEVAIADLIKDRQRDGLSIDQILDRLERESDGQSP